MQISYIDQIRSLMPRTKTKNVSKKIALIDDFNEINFEPELVTAISGSKSLVLVTEASLLLGLEQTMLKSDVVSGRSRPVVCDFCYTWVSGHNAVRSSLFSLNGTQKRVAYLTCKDLLCSLHVRALTDLSIISKAQIRESIDQQERIARLNKNIISKITNHFS